MDAIFFMLFLISLLAGSSLIAARAWYNNKQQEREKAGLRPPDRWLRR